MRSVSIIIQGPLNPISVGNIGQYRKFGEVIVSCWSNDNLELLAQHQDIKVVKTTPFNADQFSNPQNLLLQAVTTLNGLRQASGDICIKVRSDEYYSNLAPIIEILNRTPDKVICDNLYFRANWRLHVSDHLLAASKDLMLRAWGEIVRKLTQKERPYQGVPPETVVATTFIQCRGGSVKDVQSHQFIGPTHPDCRENTPEEKQLLKNTFTLMPVRHLGPFMIKVLLPSPNHNAKRHVYLTYEDHAICTAGGYRNIFNSVDEL